MVKILDFMGQSFTNKGAQLLLKGTRKYWLIAIICGLLAAFLFYRYIEELKASSQPANLVEVLIAGEAIKKDSIITAKQVKLVEIPDQYASNNCLHKKDEAIGKIAVTDMAAGEVIMPHKLLSAGRKEKLSYSVPISRRAVAIPIDAVSGVAGSVKPGDHVDIIGTLDIAAPGSDKAIAYSIFTLQDIPVLMVGDDADGQKSSAKSTVVLSVASEEVQRLVLMSERGKLRLVLRSPVDQSRVTLPPLRLEDLLQ